MRNFSTCLPQILELYWKKISDNRVLNSTISFHLSQTERPLQNPRSREFTLPENNAEILLENYSHSIFDLDKIRDDSSSLFQKLLLKGEWLGGEGRNLRNYVEAMWLQKMAFEELQKVEADTFIFCRPDIYPVTALRTTPWLWMGTAFVLTPHWGQYGGTNDRFAIIPREYLERYLCRIERSLEYINQVGPLFPERFLKWTLIGTRHLPILHHDGIRIRSGGIPNRRDLERTGFQNLGPWNVSVGL